MDRNIELSAMISIPRKNHITICDRFFRSPAVLFLKSSRRNHYMLAMESNQQNKYIGMKKKQLGKCYDHIWLV